MSGLSKCAEVQVEGVALHLVIMLAGDEGVEVGHAVESRQ
jgi:hypothetical protein